MHDESVDVDGVGKNEEQRDSGSSGGREVGASVGPSRISELEQ